MHRRGLSDIVTTVLIILLVVVAVVAIGAYVRTTVDQAGASVTSGTTCLSDPLTPLTCVIAPNGSAYTATVGFQRTNDASVSSLTNVQYVFTYNDSTTSVLNHSTSLVLPALGAGTSDVLSLVKQPTTVQLLASVGQTTCASQTFSCTVSLDTSYRCVNETRQCADLSVDVCYNSAHQCEASNSVVTKYCSEYFESNNPDKCELLTVTKSYGIESPCSPRYDENTGAYNACILSGGGAGYFVFSCGNKTYTEEVCTGTQ